MDRVLTLTEIGAIFRAPQCPFPRQGVPFFRTCIDIRRIGGLQGKKSVKNTQEVNLARPLLCGGCAAAQGHGFCTAGRELKRP